MCIAVVDSNSIAILSPLSMIIHSFKKIISSIYLWTFFSFPSAYPTNKTLLLPNGGSAEVPIRPPEGLEEGPISQDVALGWNLTEGVITDTWVHLIVALQLLYVTIGLHCWIILLHASQKLDFFSQLFKYFTSCRERVQFMISWLIYVFKWKWALQEKRDKQKGQWPFHYIKKGDKEISFVRASFPHSSYLRTFYLEIKICAWLYGTKDMISIGLPYK